MNYFAQARVCVLLALVAAWGGKARADEAIAVGSTREIGRLRGTYGAVSALVITRDGKTAVSGGFDHLLRVWDISTRQCIHTLAGHRGPIISLAITPDGRRLISGGRDGRVCIWDLPNKNLLSLIYRPGHIHGVGIADDGKITVSINCGSDEMTVIDVDADKPLWSKSFPTQPLDVAVNSAGDQFFVVYQHQIGEGKGDQYVSEIQQFSKDQTSQYTLTRKNLYTVKVLSDSQIAVSDSKGWSVVDLNTHAETKKGTTFQPFRWGDFSPDGNLFYGVEQNISYQFNAAAKKEPISLAETSEQLRAIAASADGKTILIGGGGKYDGVFSDQIEPGRDTDIRIIDPSIPLKPFAFHKGRIKNYAISPDEKYLATIDDISRMGVLEIPTKKDLTPPQRAGLRPMRNMPIFSATSQQIYVYDTPLGKAPGALVELQGVRQKKSRSWVLNRDFCNIALSRDEKYLLAARPNAVRDNQGKVIAPKNNDKDIQIVDLTTGKRLPDLPTGFQPVSSMVICPDNKRVVVSLCTPPDPQRETVEERRVVQVWNIANCKKIFEFETPKGSQAVAASEKFLAAESAGNVLLWDAQTCAALPPIEGFDDTISALYFDKTGSRLIVCVRHSIFFIDPKTGDIIQEYTLAGDDASSCFQTASGSLFVAHTAYVDTYIEKVPLPN